jgi:zinc transport system substrate-binding protein
VLKPISRLTAILVALCLMASGNRADSIKVVASIKPVHSLVAAVMGDAGMPYLIVKGQASPHTYSLKPSDARALQDAKAVFWIGDELELFLKDAVHTLAANADIVWLIDAEGLERLAFREGGPFEGHGDEESAARDGDHQGHDHGVIDMHLWLDPQNAKAMVAEIAQALSKADPKNAQSYQANAERVSNRLDVLNAEITELMKPVKDRRFIMFHDAYQYFENRYGLTATGSITVNPELMPGARRIKEIRAKVKTLGAICVFAEPQFSRRLVDVVTEGLPTRYAIVDPLGSGLTEGPDLYFEMMRGIAKSVRACLSSER